MGDNDMQETTRAVVFCMGDNCPQESTCAMVPCLGDCGAILKRALALGLLAFLWGAGYTAIAQVTLESVPVMDFGLVCDDVGEHESLELIRMAAMDVGQPKDATGDMFVALGGFDTISCLTPEMPIIGADVALLGSLHFSPGDIDSASQVDPSTLFTTASQQQFAFNNHPAICLPSQDCDTSISLPIDTTPKDVFSYQSKAGLDGNSDVSESFTKVSHAVLQILCKKFNIKDNMKNFAMAQALSLLARSNDQVMVALQETLDPFSLTRRVKKNQLNTDEQQTSAKRIDTDEDTMSKAQRLATKRNFETSEFSSITYKPKTITSNMKHIGVNLGKNEKEV